MRSASRAGVLAALAAVVVAGGCGAGGGAASDAGTHPDGAGDVASGGDAPGGAVDCRATCDGIAAICAGMSTIDQNWLSICRQNCETRIILEPDVAQLEQACVAAAADCATAVLCSVDPIGSRG